MIICEDTGKITYERRSDAEHRLQCITTRRHGKSGKAYQCKWCRGWHLTASSRPTPAALKRRGADRVRDVREW